MLNFDHGGSTPSPVLRIIHTPFLVALRSPFSQNTFAAIPPPAALCGKEVFAYSLFLNGFQYFNT